MKIRLIVVSLLLTPMGQARAVETGKCDHDGERRAAAVEIETLKTQLARLARLYAHLSEEVDRLAARVDGADPVPGRQPITPETPAKPFELQ